MTIDQLLDSIIATLSDKVELQGMREGISKEFYGIFIPSSNTWCRAYAKANEYELYKKVMYNPKKLYKISNVHFFFQYTKGRRR